MTTLERFHDELEAYERHKDALLAQGAGKFVLIHRRDVIGTWDTYEDALKAGYDRYGVAEPFMVKCIEGLEGVQFFSRDVNPCPV